MVPSSTWQGWLEPPSLPVVGNGVSHEYPVNGATADKLVVNSRYSDNEGRFTYGKRHYKFAFNRGHRFQARDQDGTPFPQKWKSPAVNKMFGNKGGNGWGMPEEIGATLWSTFGVPAANTYWFHFRVIDGADEAPDQYNGDFWGIQQIVEEYESTSGIPPPPKACPTWTSRI